MKKILIFTVIVMMMFAQVSFAQVQKTDECFVYHATKNNGTWCTSGVNCCPNGYTYQVVELGDQTKGSGACINNPANESSYMPESKNNLAAEACSGTFKSHASVYMCCKIK